MKTAALSEVKDDLSRFLRMAEREQVLITRHGKPAGIIWFDYKLEHDERFLPTPRPTRPPGDTP